MRASSRRRRTALPTAWSAIGRRALQRHPAFAPGMRYNTRAHKIAGYRIVFVSLKKHGEAPGDMTDAQMDALADLADA
jgi:sulfite reductase (NADPH) hemoprotein beta-component